MTTKQAIASKLSKAALKALETGVVMKVTRQVAQDADGNSCVTYTVPSSNAGITYTVSGAMTTRGVDLATLACDCPAGANGRDCYHRAAVLIRATLERNAESLALPVAVVL
jgi:hypothetical protein